MNDLDYLRTLCLMISLFPIINGIHWNEQEGPFFPNKNKLLDRLERENLEVSEKVFDLKKMNISMLRKLNSLKSREDFAGFFGFFTPELRTRLGFAPSGEEVADALTDESIPEANNVGCAPVPSIVPLTPTSDLSVIYYPTCVLLDRCGGCCYGTMLSCQPETTEKVKLSVMKIKQGTNVTDGTRARPKVKPEYETITEVKHKTCSCKCVLQAKDCNAELQIYDSNECSCKCKDKSAESTCETVNADHYWDARKCFCFCRKVNDCSTGETFDHKTCKCASRIGNTGITAG